jgi:uncharacterized protein YndB with AHSA1/START domain
MAPEKKRLRVKIRLDADPTRIYDAITNPLKLSIWFCNKAEINLKLRGAVHFWGDDCVATTFKEKEIKGAITALEPNHEMRFTWPINGMVSEVGFLIDDRGRGRELVVSHEKIPVNSFMLDAWIIYLYNLQSLIKYQRPAYRLDYSRFDKEAIKRELFIEALPSVVYKALTDTNDLRAWFSRDAECEPVVGGKYLTGWKDRNGRVAGPREIKELVENKKLVYDWDYAEEGKSGDLVTWELLRIGERTRVNLRHSGFDPARYNKDYMQGWHAYLLTLKDYCESGGRLAFSVIDGDWGA